jgi:hypothetical protein
MQKHKIEITGTYLPNPKEYEILLDCIRQVELNLRAIEFIREKYAFNLREVKIAVYNGLELVVDCGVFAHIYKDPKTLEVICKATDTKQELHLTLEMLQESFKKLG